MVDLAFSLVLVVLAVLALGAYVAWVRVHGPARNERVEREGHSALLTKGTMEMYYWALAPVGSFFVRYDVHPNTVTFGSLVFGVAAGVAIGMGHLGIGGLLAAVSAIGDGLDGVVARATHRASAAGEIVDAVVDRYTELALLAGIAIYMHDSVPMLVLTILAINASFMISYSSAKAEAMHVTPPRGSMRRSERAVCLVTGTTLVPIVHSIDARFSMAPLFAALVLVAAIGNVSAVRRFTAITRSVRGRSNGKIAHAPTAAPSTSSSSIAAPTMPLPRAWGTNKDQPQSIRPKESP